MTQPLPDPAVPAPPARPTRAGVVFLVVVGAVIALCGAGALFGGGGSGQGYVIVACENWVKARLRSPASADFSGETATEGTSGAWMVTGRVDSQNGFGALVRSAWVCKATRDGDSTRLVDLKIS